MPNDQTPPPCDQPPHEPPKQVVSLCARRKEHTILATTARLLDTLKSLHTTAVGLHNEIISRAEVSVLAEFCRTTGFCFDSVGKDLQCSVVVPAVLYGESENKIFGKKPLQDEVRASLRVPEELRLYDALNKRPPAIWHVEHREGALTDQAHPLAGASADPLDLVGAIVRHGTLARQSGTYIGWMIQHEDLNYLLFAYRLGDAQLKAIQQLLTDEPHPDDPRIWHRLELPLLRRIVAPEHDDRQLPAPEHDDRQLPSTGQTPIKGLAIRPPATRRGLLMQIRRTLWRHFAEPSHGLTIHAHLAALVDDPEGFEAFLEELDEIQTSVTLRFGGLPAHEPPITPAEVLTPFGFRPDGTLRRPPFDDLPARHLLTGPSILESVDLHLDSPLHAVRTFVDEHYDHPLAAHLHSALLVFQTELSLIATYDLYRDDTPPNASGQKWHDTFEFAQKSPVLPNLRTLFDPRFMAHRLADLPLDDDTRHTLDQGLNAWGTDLQSFTLDDIPSDERWLLELPAVGLNTCNALRTALLNLGKSWRFSI